MCLAGAGAADQHRIALLGEEAAAGEVADEGFVDRRVGEAEIAQILGQGQLGDAELVADRARLLVGDLRAQQVPKHPLRLVLAFDGGGHDLVEGRLHAEELERAHQGEERGPVHQPILRRVS